MHDVVEGTAVPAGLMEYFQHDILYGQKPGMVKSCPGLYQGRSCYGCDI